jgi:hypothetical protein
MCILERNVSQIVNVQKMATEREALIARVQNMTQRGAVNNFEVAQALIILEPHIKREQPGRWIAWQKETFPHLCRGTNNRWMRVARVYVGDPKDVVALKKCYDSLKMQGKANEKRPRKVAKKVAKGKKATPTEKELTKEAYEKEGISVVTEEDVALFESAENLANEIEPAIPTEEDLDYQTELRKPIDHGGLFDLMLSICHSCDEENPLYTRLEAMRELILGDYLEIRGDDSVAAVAARLAQIASGEPLVEVEVLSVS